jgi:ABC-2 type transport system permease protein
MLAKPLAFIKRDFLNESRHKAGFFLNIISVFISILGYYYIDRLFGNKIAPQLEEFGVNYFAYVLLGMAFFSYAGVGLGSFSSRIEMERLEGTLEAVLLTPTSIPTILFSLGLWNLIIATIDAVIYVLFGIFLFKIDFGQTNLLSVAVLLILTIASFSGLGILSASFLMAFRRGNPVGWLINTLEGLIGGVYFPVAVLPDALQIIARCLPITYGIRGMQLAIYRGSSVWQLREEIGFLFLFSIVLLPLATLSFKKGLRKARRDGTLALS